MWRLIPRYLLMITPPLLGILGLLQLGRGLTPPVSVKGAWSLELDARTPTRALCGLDLSVPSLTVAQSGPQLQVTLNDANKTTLMGEIRSSTITADGRIGAPASALHLEATSDPQAIPDRLYGRLSLPNCSTSAAIEFTATRMLSGVQP